MISLTDEEMIEENSYAYGMALRAMDEGWNTYSPCEICNFEIEFEDCDMDGPDRIQPTGLRCDCCTEWFCNSCYPVHLIQCFEEAHDAAFNHYNACVLAYNGKSCEECESLDSYYGATKDEVLKNEQAMDIITERGFLGPFMVFKANVS